MKAKILGLTVSIPLITAGVLAGIPSANAITLNAGDQLDLAFDLDISVTGEFTWLTPDACIGTGCDFEVINATGGFAPFGGANSNNAGYQIPDSTLKLTPGIGADFQASGTDAVDGPGGIFNQLQLLNSAGGSPAIGDTRIPVAANGLYEWLTLEIGDSALNPDLTVFIEEVTFFNNSLITPTQELTAVAADVFYVADNEIKGKGTFTSQFNSNLTEVSGSGTFTVEAIDVPEPFSILGSALALGLGALSLKRKSKKVLPVNFPLIDSNN